MFINSEKVSSANKLYYREYIQIFLTQLNINFPCMAGQIIKQTRCNSETRKVGTTEINPLIISCIGFLKKIFRTKWNGKLNSTCWKVEFCWLNLQVKNVDVENEHKITYFHSAFLYTLSENGKRKPCRKGMENNPCGAPGLSIDSKISICSSV